MLTTFGILFASEVIVVVVFITGFASMCFGPNARWYDFGSNPDGSCSAAEFVRPVATSAGTLAIHVLAYIGVCVFVRRRYNVSAWRPAWEWIEKYAVGIFAAVLIVFSQIMALFLRHYGVRSFMASLV